MIKPPLLEDMRYGQTLRAGLSHSTIIADFDFETYSPAGYCWDETLGKFIPPHGASEKGLGSVGVVQYTEHPDAEVLCLAYDLKDGKGRRLWVPYSSAPTDLFEHLASGKLIEAWNVGFEYYVWTNICVPKYGFPPLPVSQLRCAMAKARASAYPGALGKCAEVMQLTNQKDKEGQRLLKLFSAPCNPTPRCDHRRNYPSDYTDDFRSLCNYCEQDIATEAEASSRIPDLSDFELQFWQADQAINRRGIAVDLESIDHGIAIIEQAYDELNTELFYLTGGSVDRHSELAKILKWMGPGYGNSLDSDSIEKLLERQDLPFTVRRVLVIRQILASAAVKKLYAMKNQVGKDGRLHDLFIYHSSRTGRAAGAGPQPQNLPNSGPESVMCPECNKLSPRRYLWSDDDCPNCLSEKELQVANWNRDIVEDCIGIWPNRSLSMLSDFWNDPLGAIAGCLRGMFIAAPGKVLICADYSAIEAVVLAELAGEQWRRDVFNTHGMIYEMSASKITGIPFEEFVRHKRETGQHHPLRKTIGKVAELASGYQGWIGAWKAFGASSFMSDEEMKGAILAWRKASPAIVEFWGGQYRGWCRELFGVEGSVIQAIQFPGFDIVYRGLRFKVQADVLYITLLSGRNLTYHEPRLEAAIGHKKGLSISYMGWNTNPKQGQLGWTRMSTYGGKLVENIVQATARDLLAHAIVNLEKAGMPVVLHVHDEIVCEVPNQGVQNVAALVTLERIMSTMPAWAAGWPVKATGGWVNTRYGK